MAANEKPAAAAAAAPAADAGANAAPKKKAGLKMIIAALAGNDRKSVPDVDRTITGSVR